MHVTRMLGVAPLLCAALVVVPDGLVAQSAGASNARVTITSSTGVPVGDCQMRPADCAIAVPRGAHGIHRALVERNGHVIHHSLFALRGSERQVTLHLEGHQLTLRRVHRPPSGLTLTLRSPQPNPESPSTPEFVLRNRTPVSLVGTDRYQNFFGSIARREGGQWTRLVRVDCAATSRGEPLPPGREAIASAPDYHPSREPLRAASRYRFDLAVELASAGDWDRHARALGGRRVRLPTTEPLTSAADVITLGIRFWGSEALDAVGTVPPAPRE